MKSRKTFVNIIISSVYQIVAIICGLITPRLILLAFGSTYNGAFSSATQFLGLISALSMGIPGAARLELYRLLSTKDTEGISKVVKATQIYSQKVSLVIIIYATLLCLIFPHISNSDLSWMENTLVIVIVAIGLFAEYFFGMAYYNVIDADQKQFIRFILKIIATIVNTILVAILIKLGCNVFTVKLVSSLVFTISPLFVYWYVKKTYHIDKMVETDMSVIPQRKNVLIHAISSFVYEHIDIFVLTILMDFKYVSIYTVYHMVIHYLRVLLEIFTGDLESVFGSLWIEKNNSRIDPLFSAYETFAYIFIAIIFSCAGLLIVPFVDLYTAGVYDINYHYLDIGFLIVLSEALYCVRDPYRILIQATGSYEQTRTGVILEALVNLVLSIILTVIIGFDGVLLGTVIATAITIIQFSWFVTVRILNRKYSAFLKRIIWTIITISIITFIYMKMNLSAVYTWSGWIKNALIIFTIAFSITILAALIFYKKDLTVLYGKIKMALIKHL